MNNFITDTVKGFKDIDGIGAHLIEQIINIAIFHSKKYGIRPIFTPIVEKEQLFVKSLGDTTDIVTKEIFRIQSDDNLILRPEQTSSIIRWAIKNRWDLNGQPRVYSYGPMFRHENPQKGRWRQFNQFNVEFINHKNIIHDAEIIMVTKDIIEGILETFQLPKDLFILKINSIGTAQDRQKYSEYLKEKIINNSFFSQESQEKCRLNPLRVLDTKNPNDIKQLNQLEILMNFINSESQDNWKTLLKLLDSQSINYQWDPYLVRGLDYYNDLVFEWVINDNEISKAAVLAGGRYDKLAFSLTGKYNLCNIGFALGIDRFVDYILPLLKNNYNNKIVAVVNIDSTEEYLLKVINFLKDKISIQILNHRNLSDNLKFIDKNNNYYSHKVIIIGALEEENQTVIIKDLNQQKQDIICLKTIGKDIFNDENIKY